MYKHYFESEQKKKTFTTSKRMKMKMHGFDSLSCRIFFRPFAGTLKNGDDNDDLLWM